MPSPRQAPAPNRRWQARLILSAFVAAVGGAAVAGWWYARESSPHLGPIVLIAADGLDPGSVPSPDAAAGATSAIGALAADSVRFERAYAHSPLALPGHVSLLAGQLPFEHGVRDEAGFTLSDDVRPLAELMRNRGFDTGAAVSSFLLRRDSGVAQGFSFFGAVAEPDSPDPQETPALIVERSGTETVAAATQWVHTRQGHRFFLFLQVADDDAEAAVAQVTMELRDLGLYDQATIVLTANRAVSDVAAALHDQSLRVPLLVKQPGREGAGRTIAVPVQHIDLLPTVLDLVRAPVPSGLRGRSLRALLGGDNQTLPDRPVYAESLAAWLRFGGSAKFALVDASGRYARIESTDPFEAEPADDSASPAETADDEGRLLAQLDGLIKSHPFTAPQPVATTDEDRLGLLGFLGGAPLRPVNSAPLEPEDEAQVAKAHRTAATLAARKEYAAAVTQLRGIARAHPGLPLVHYQAGTLLARAGRLGEADTAFRAAARAEPDSPYVQIARADLMLRAGREADAEAAAALSVALAEHDDEPARAAAFSMAALVAVARADRERAIAYAEAAERHDPTLPMVTVVTGRLHYAAGRFEDALTAFENAVKTQSESPRPLPGLHGYLGDTLARLDRLPEAETAFREELRLVPDSLQAYTGLAGLYQAADRPGDFENTIEALMKSVPTPEGYDAAVRLWTAAGDRARATAIRTDARARFRGDPSLAILDRRR